MKRVTFLLIGLMAFAATPVAAQSVCGDRNEIVSRLESGYEEKAAAIGLSSNGGVVELYRSKKGSWTLLITKPDGVSCLLAAGEYWENTPNAKLDLGDSY